MIAPQTLARTVGRLPIVLVIPFVAAGAVAVGIGALVVRFGPHRDGTPAPPGTPQLPGRLPISLWPSDGNVGHVEHGLAGWRAMASRLYHRDTRVDVAALARAIVIAEYGRREVEARRAVALEAHVLRATYDPALVAAAWLHPTEARPGDLLAFGIDSATIDTLRARATLAADADLSPIWRREFGLDVVHPEVTDAIIAETPPAGRARLWAVLLELAELRVRARQPLRRGA